MKQIRTHSLSFALAIALYGLAWPARAQSGSLEDHPYKPSTSVVNGTLAALSDSSEDVVALAVRSLGDWRQVDASANIVKLLDASTPEIVRLEAFKFFARLGPLAKPFVASVLKHAADPDPNIRLEVLRVVLQSQTSTDHIQTVAALLGDSRADVRKAAAQCLGQAGKAAAPQRQALFDTLKKSGNPEFIASTLQALEQIGGTTLADVEAIKRYLDHRDAEVRAAAWTFALSGLVEAQAVSPANNKELTALRESLRARFHAEPAEIQAAIIEDAATNQLAIEACIPELVNQIRSGTVLTRAAALRSLGKAGAAALKQVPLLLEQAKDADPVTRSAAIAGLGGLGAEAVKPNLALIANALRDSSDLVRNAALEALPAAGDALTRFPYKIRDVFATESAPVRATLMKAAPIVVGAGGISDDELTEGRAAMKDSNPEVRTALLFVVSQFGGKMSAALLPDVMEMTKDADVSVRGAAAITLRGYAAAAAERPRLRASLRPLLKDPDVDVRWAALDTLHELEPAQDPGLLDEIAALVKDEDESVRTAAIRALGAGGAASKPFLPEIIRFFDDNPAVPPYAAAQAVLELSPLTPQELTSLLYPIYVYAELQPITRLTAYGASGGDRDSQILLGLLGRSRLAAKDALKPGEAAHAIELLQSVRTAPLLHDILRAEINARLAELQQLR